MSNIAVIDIGKTNAKLALVDRVTLHEIAVLTRPNTVIDGPPWPHFDVDGHREFLLDGLASLHASHGIDVISLTTHGASAALIGYDGNLAAPILDYEHDGPDTLAGSYNALRPPFDETGSPRLPGGLNLGAQLHWQFAQNPALLEQTKSIVTYPQYWGFWLTGHLACDMSSLGCHTDLWNPFKAEFSSLVQSLGIEDKIAPARKSADVLGTLHPEIATRTGLAPGTSVLCGIHDSNASLLPHILSQSPPFSVVSTGTWVIAMTIGGSRRVLDSARDALMNVNALGQPVPSARFMGGREYEILLGETASSFDRRDMAEVAKKGPMLMPSIVSDCGPFQGQSHGWVHQEPVHGSAERAVAVGYYLALMTAECLSLTSHQGPIIVEGPFSTNASYCAMLAAATNSPVQAAKGLTGTSQGAALLALDPKALPSVPPFDSFRPDQITGAADYASRWHKAVTS